MNRVTLYALGLLVEEMGEALKWIGKAMRFGLDVPSPSGETPREGLTLELGDVFAATDYATEAKIVDAAPLTQQAGRKLKKLLDPASVDHIGRRLAPDPKGTGE